ncbi:hypothetical protein NJ959_11750, partial [Symplocastrum sp. BBK-W-15]|nr:hypothetical protein [Limnofasciculus baicalensis BBK-W-15]
MDEQRIQAYLTLINTLLNCPNGEEVQLLQANSELVDEGLVQVMVGVAQQMAEAGNENTANWLLQFASQLAEWLGISSTSPTREDYLNFLLYILQAVATDNSPQSVYPLLRQNLDKLNQNLVQILEIWVREKFGEVTPEEAAYIARVIGNFSNLMQEFPLGDIASNKEIAIAGYEAVATIYTESDFPQAWATIQNNLASAYNNRIAGDKKENLEMAIAHYHNALRIRTESDFPQ